MTGYELLAAYTRALKGRNYSTNTMSSYRQAITRFLVWCGDEKLELLEVDHQDIVRWLDTCRVGPRARYAYISTLAAFWAWLTREEHAQVDPTARVDRPRLGRYLPRPAGGEQIRYALAHAEPRVAAMIALGAFAGMRRMEIANLRAEDLLLQRLPAVILVHGKGGRERLVPLHDEILLALRRHGLPKQGWIFQNRDGGALTPAYVGKLIMNELSTLDLHVTTHQLRHFFGSEVYRLSKDIRLTQELLGHTNPANTAIYTAWSREDAHAVVGRLDLNA